MSLDLLSFPPPLPRQSPRLFFFVARLWCPPEPVGLSLRARVRSSFRAVDRLARPSESVGMEKQSSRARISIPSGRDEVRGRNNCCRPACTCGRRRRPQGNPCTAPSAGSSSSSLCGHDTQALRLHFDLPFGRTPLLTLSLWALAVIVRISLVYLPPPFPRVKLTFPAKDSGLKRFIKDRQGNHKGTTSTRPICGHSRPRRRA